MAEEKNIKALEEELAAAKAEAEALREKVGPQDKTGMPIPGKIEVELETPGGKKEKKSLKFQPGYEWCRIPSVKDNPIPARVGVKVKSASLMKLATGKKLSPEEIADSPALDGVDKATASAWLTHLARIRAGFLVPA